MRRVRDEGASAVETALVLPILILIVFGIVEFGLAFNREQGVHAAAREAARLGSILGVPADDIRDRAIAAAPPFLDTGDLQVNIERIEVLEDGTESASDTWTWNPASSTWSSGSGTTSPCDPNDEPNPSNPADNTEVAQALVRVELQQVNGTDYRILLFGSFTVQHSAEAEFRCEY